MGGRWGQESGRDKGSMGVRVITVREKMAKKIKKCRNTNRKRQREANGERLLW